MNRKLAKKIVLGVAGLSLIFAVVQCARPGPALEDVVGLYVSKPNNYILTLSAEKHYHLYLNTEGVLNEVANGEFDFPNTFLGDPRLEFLNLITAISDDKVIPAQSDKVWTSFPMFYKWGRLGVTMYYDELRYIEFVKQQ